jgi:hypothetical protein
VVLHLRLSRDQVSGDLLRRRALHQRRCQGSMHGSEGRRDNAAERRANESQPWHCDIFSTGRVVSVLWGRGDWQGAGREQVELGSGLRHELEGRESRGEKGGRELMEKRRGTSASLYLAKDRAGR